MMVAMADRRIALLVNPAAGGGTAAAALESVQERLTALGLVHRTGTTTSLADGRDQAREAVAAGEIPVVLSGDGLVGAVAAELASLPDAVMGVLPGGRGNDFARCVGIPLEPVAACDVLGTGEARAFDLGLVGEAPFIGIASLGFDSVANRIANEAPARLGELVYAYAALRALVTWKHATFTVHIDGKAHTFTGWSVAVANSRAYGGGMFVAPHADLHDGKLDVIFSEACSKLSFLRRLPQVFKGKHLEDRRVHEHRGVEIRIAADRPFTVYADGDPIGELPVTVRTLPAAVRVLVPAGPEPSVDGS